jgi:hypothetical protein
MDSVFALISIVRRPPQWRQVPVTAVALSQSLRLARSVAVAKPQHRWSPDRGGDADADHGVDNVAMNGVLVNQSPARRSW